MSSTQLNQTNQSLNPCEVCGGQPPHGHRFCDDCWPEKVIAVGKAARCEICDTPKVIEKLSRDTQGRLVCNVHL
jgi:hypothetical protein